MPELPEVETVSQGIKSKLLNHKISKVIVKRRDLRFRMDTKLEQKITNTKINSVSRRAKYILINLDNGLTVIIHLGMSGRIVVEDLKSSKNIFKHTHLEIITTGKKKMKFIDPRRFGSVLLHETNNLNTHKLIKNLAPEPLTKEFNATYLFKALKGRSANIKSIIMNQFIVVGVGNIYASESLYKAKIRPGRQAKSLSLTECVLLAKSIKKVLKRSIKLGGSSINDYSLVDGNLGFFQSEFEVYGKEGKICRKKTCHSKILRIVIAQRSSFYCSKCQK
ncbi:bifunctional DNA-formamidopyrimidine glycosylase/DNA-(apurinic or apyrimidinic site) lyase [Pelagibacterales bacterium]|jgi:formamidopyrimidine-DNA glycosylase|nr:bifunctional DNA-formamidopyrimidine glycosylase/DNA-(apurinic or apyrimidinic site) lyase [Pelagibacterales bacterium]